MKDKDLMTPGLETTGCTIGCGCLIACILFMIGIILTLIFWITSMGKYIIDLFN